DLIVTGVQTCALPISIDGQLLTLDVSEIQARKPDPVVREVSRLTWNSVAIPQNTAPMVIGGHPYVLEFDEFAWRFTQVPQDFNRSEERRVGKECRCRG